MVGDPACVPPAVLLVSVVLGVAVALVAPASVVQFLAESRKLCRWSCQHHQLTQDQAIEARRVMQLVPLLLGADLCSLVVEVGTSFDLQEVVLEEAAEQPVLAPHRLHSGRPLQP